jgi:hypothetical protein
MIVKRKNVLFVSKNILPRGTKIKQNGQNKRDIEKACLQKHALRAILI